MNRKQKRKQYSRKINTTQDKNTKSNSDLERYSKGKQLYKW